MVGWLAAWACNIHSSCLIRLSPRFLAHAFVVSFIGCYLSVNGSYEVLNLQQRQQQ